MIERNFVKINCPELVGFSIYLDQIGNGKAYQLIISLRIPRCI